MHKSAIAVHFVPETRSIAFDFAPERPPPQPLLSRTPHCPARHTLAQYRTSRRLMLAPCASSVPDIAQGAYRMTAEFQYHALASYRTFLRACVG
eukprot:1842041-Rhodomonas_salina.2